MQLHACEETLTGRPHDTSVEKATMQWQWKCGSSLTSFPGHHSVRPLPSRSSVFSCSRQWWSTMAKDHHFQHNFMNINQHQNNSNSQVYSQQNQDRLNSVSIAVGSRPERSRSRPCKTETETETETSALETMVLVSGPSLRSILHARSQLFLGHNVLFCAHRYNISVNVCNRLSSLDNLAKSCVHNSIDDNMRCFANLLYELIMIRERRIYLNDSVRPTFNWW